MTPSHPDWMAAEPCHQYHCWHHPTQIRWLLKPGHQYHCWHCPSQIGWLLSQATNTIADTVLPRLNGCSARPTVPLLTPSYQDQMAAEPGHQYHYWHCPTQIGWLLSQATSTIADTVPPGADGSRARPSVPLLTLSLPDWRAAQPGHQYYCWHRPTQIRRLLNQATGKYHCWHRPTEPGHQYHCWHHPTQIRWLLSQATTTIAYTVPPRLDGSNTSTISDTVPLSQATSTIADTILPSSVGCWARPLVPLLTLSLPDQMIAQPGHQYHCWHHPIQIGWLLSQATSTTADTAPPRLDGCSARPAVPLLTPSHPDQMTAQPGHQYHCWHHPTKIRWLLSQPSRTIADTVPPRLDGCSARPPVTLLTPSHPDWMAAEPCHQYHCWHHPTQIRWLLSQATSTIADTVPPRSDGCSARQPIPLLTPSYPDRMAAQPGHQYHCWHRSTRSRWL